MATTRRVNRNSTFSVTIAVAIAAPIFVALASPSAMSEPKELISVWESSTLSGPQSGFVPWPPVLRVVI